MVGTILFAIITNIQILALCEGLSVHTVLTGLNFEGCNIYTIVDCMKYDISEDIQTDTVTNIMLDFATFGRNKLIIVKHTGQVKNAKIRNCHTPIPIF